MSVRHIDINNYLVFLFIFIFICFFIFLCAAYSRSLWSVCNIRAHMKPLIDCSMQCIINFLQMKSELYAFKYIRVLYAQFSSFFDYWLRLDSSSFHFSLSLVGFFSLVQLHIGIHAKKMLVSVDNSRVSKLANINGFDYTDSLLHRTDRNGCFSFFLASSLIFKYQFGFVMNCSSRTLYIQICTCSFFICS